jgi:hypothetical protein
MQVRLLVDEQLIGYRDFLNRLTRLSDLEIFAEDVGLQFFDFEDVGLQQSIQDDVLWLWCQENEYILFTQNRNSKGTRSLGETIRNMNENHHLPVITLGDLDRFREDTRYAQLVVDSIIEYANNLDNYRGTGRIYAPPESTR